MLTMRTKLFVALMLVSASICYGQLDNATILGTVADSSGGVIANATVTVKNQGTAAVVNLTTDSNGNFIAPVLPIGTYTVSASAKGFKTYVQEDIILHVADRVKLPVTLEPGEISEKVTVTAEAPVVETASTTLGAVINTQQVAELPLNGRSLASLIGLAPGVVMLGTGQQRSMNGTSQTRLFESGTRFLLDGADSGQVDSDIVDSAYASSARITRTSVDAVAEIRIQESAFSAEYGQAMGGVVNFITKSGSNSFHGGLFEYFRNEKLDSRNYFNVPPAQKPPFRLNQFGGTWGGRIKRDKIFFFVNYEAIRQRLGTFQNTFVPTQAFRDTLSPAVRAEADLLPPPNGPVSPAEPRLAGFTRGISNQLTEDTGGGKVDYLISDRDRLSLRYSGNGSFTKNWFGVGDNQFRSVPSLLQLAKMTYTKTISPTLLNEAGLALNRQTWYAGAAGSAALLATPIVPSVAGMASIGPALFDLPVSNTSITWQDTMTWVKGRQQIKVGTQIVRNRDNKAITPQPYEIFLSLNDFAANNPFLLITIGQPRVGMRNTYDHFFVQDDIQATHNLTLNLGVRYQFDTSPTESHGRIANFNPATGDIDPAGSEVFTAPKLSFGPRIGFAYAPFGSKQTVFRGGFGIFHSAFVAAAAQSLPGNLPGLSNNSTTVFPGRGFPAPPTTPAIIGRALNAFPKDWKTSYTEHWSFNIQQGFGQNTVLQVGYVGNRGLHLSPAQELNRINPATGTRQYKTFSTITNFFDGANSNYNSLQVTFRRRLTRGLTFNANYTWGHSLDQGGVSFGTGAQDDANLRAEYGNADYDVRHNLEFDYTYEIPTLSVLPKAVFGGWQINGLTVMRSGLPFNIACGCDPVGIGAATGRPDYIGGTVRPSNYDEPTNQLNLAAFKTPVGHFGNLGRNVFSGPAAFNWDFSLFKNYKITEAQSVQFRAEMFNIFNTPQFSNPAAATNAPTTFGQTFSTIPAVGLFGSNRQLQFALRYAF